MKLYHYWRSSSSWRVRWALEYKKIPCELVQINLLDVEPEHYARHPFGFVPVLELDSGEILVESLAIINYLEATFPTTPSLYPQDPIQRAKALALAEVINAGTHPLQNPTVSEYLGTTFGLTGEQQKRWNQNWISKGLELYEKLSPDVIQSELSIAEICLLPQLYNAERYEVSLNSFPKIKAIKERFSQLDSFQRSHADRYQPK